MANFNGEQSPTLSATEQHVFDVEGGYTPDGTFYRIMQEATRQEETTEESETEK